MQPDSSHFLSWQQAEHRASAAESALFATVLAADSRGFPSRQQVEEVRALRESANALLRQMVDHMGDQAAALDHRRPQPGIVTPRRGVRRGALAPGENR